MCPQCATLSFERDLALGRLSNVILSAAKDDRHNWERIPIVIEKKESGPMFKNTKFKDPACNILSVLEQQE
jgi:hypothetical protein